MYKKIWKHVEVTENCTALSISGSYVISHRPRRYVVSYRPLGEHHHVGVATNLREAKELVAKHRMEIAQ